MHAIPVLIPERLSRNVSVRMVHTAFVGGVNIDSFFPFRFLPRTRHRAHGRRYAGPRTHAVENRLAGKITVARATKPVRLVRYQVRSSAAALARASYPGCERRAHGRKPERTDRGRSRRVGRRVRENGARNRHTRIGARPPVPQRIRGRSRQTRFPGVRRRATTHRDAERHGRVHGPRRPRRRTVRERGAAAGRRRKGSGSPVEATRVRGREATADVETDRRTGRLGDRDVHGEYAQRRIFNFYQGFSRYNSDNIFIFRVIFYSRVRNNTVSYILAECACPF